MKQLSRVACLLIGAPRLCQSFVVSPLNFQYQSSLQLQSRRTSSQDIYDDDDDDTDDDAYWEESPYEKKQGNRNQRSYTDDSYFEEGYVDDEDDEESGDDLDWEECDNGSTFVVLPPSYVSQPTAVLHFCGGTIFGSSPKLWYGPLLEGIVRATNCAIVATCIPVTVLQSPLQHVTLSRKLQRQFQSAYVEILEDEYGQNVMEDIPIVALGHSLGSRLLAVLATLAPPKNAAAPPYTSYILMSFTNYGASASIPGIQQLLSSRRTIDEGRGTPPPRRGRRWDSFDADDAFGDEIEELIDDLQGSVREQSGKVRDALTPLPEDLEFFPSPNQLWDALGKDKRYTVPQTLIVQFDDDEVDQSAKLALSLTDSTDIKYTRLRGNHLSPVSVQAKDGSWLEFPSRASKVLWKVMRGKSIKKRTPTESKTMRDLRQSIARYITEVATK